MTTKDEALALALQALKPRPGMPNPEYQSLMECAIEAIEEVQSRPEQEPVAWELAEKVRADLDRQSCPGFYMNLAMESIVKHYTSPPPRQPLTDEQIAEIAAKGHYQRWIEFARAIEAKLKEKNA